MDQMNSGPSQRMLIPLDGSFFAEQAQPYALAIGGKEAELILLEVIPAAEDVRGPLGNVLIPAEELRRLHAEGSRPDFFALGIPGSALGRRYGAKQRPATPLRKFPA